MAVGFGGQNRVRDVCQEMAADEACENKEASISVTIKKGGSPVYFIRASDGEWEDMKAGAEQIRSEVNGFFRDAIKKTK